MRKTTIFVILSIIVLIVLLFTNQSHTVNWSPTFDDAKTNPLDTKVFFDQAPFFSNGKASKKIYTTFYEYDQLLQEKEPDSLKNYITISGRYDIDETSFNALLEYVEYGNQAFISAYHFPNFVQDTLGFTMGYEPVEIKEKKCTLSLNNTKDTIRYTQKLPYGTSYILDSTLTNANKKLGTILEKKEKRTNFIGVPYGDGIFYIHTSPEVFTNYQMLEAENTNYVSTVISYLPTTLPTLIDKAIKIDPETSQSPLRFILSKSALKWGWYLLLLAIGLFMLFNAKRRQRIIPIKIPLKNNTTEFVHTVSNLHYEAEDYNGIIQKSIVHFLEHIRSTYHLQTDKLDADFVSKLAMRTGKPVEDIQQLIMLIIKMRAHVFKTKDALLNLNKEIEKFHKQP